MLNFIFISDNDINVQKDEEMQAFRQELVRPSSMNQGGGCGMNVYHFSFVSTDVHKLIYL